MLMQKTACVLVLAPSLMLSGCAGRIPAPKGPPGVPRVGWVLMHGDRDNPDREYACQSGDSANCVVPMSRPNEQVFTAIYFYYHSTPTDTTYTGTHRIGFFNGAEPLEIRAGVTVKANGSAANQSVTGIASARPGTYPLTIAVAATPAAGGPARQLREQVQISVR